MGPRAPRWLGPLRRRKKNNKKSPLHLPHPLSPVAPHLDPSPPTDSACPTQRWIFLKPYIFTRTCVYVKLYLKNTLKTTGHDVIPMPSLVRHCLLPEGILSYFITQRLKRSILKLLSFKFFVGAWHLVGFCLFLLGSQSTMDKHCVLLFTIVCALF